MEADLTRGQANQSHVYGARVRPPSFKSSPGVQPFGSHQMPPRYKETVPLREPGFLASFSILLVPSNIPAVQYSLLSQRVKENGGQVCSSPQRGITHIVSALSATRLARWFRTNSGSPSLDVLLSMLKEVEIHSVEWLVESNKRKAVPPISSFVPFTQGELCQAVEDVFVSADDNEPDNSPLSRTNSLVRNAPSNAAVSFSSIFESSSASGSFSVPAAGVRDAPSPKAALSSGAAPDPYALSSGAAPDPYALSSGAAPDPYDQPSTSAPQRPLPAFLSSTGKIARRTGSPLHSRSAGLTTLSRQQTSKRVPPWLLKAWGRGKMK